MSKPKTKSYNLVLPESLYEQLKKEAEANQMTFVELIRRFIKLGLFTQEALKEDGVELILRRDGSDEKSLILL